jgi:hypothetical protein
MTWRRHSASGTRGRVRTSSPSSRRTVASSLWCAASWPTGKPRWASIASWARTRQAPSSSSRPNTAASGPDTRSSAPEAVPPSPTLTALCTGSVSRPSVPRPRTGHRCPPDTVAALASRSDPGPAAPHRRHGRAGRFDAVRRWERLPDHSRQLGLPGGDDAATDLAILDRRRLGPLIANAIQRRDESTGPMPTPSPGSTP